MTIGKTMRINNKNGENNANREGGQKVQETKGIAPSIPNLKIRAVVSAFELVRAVGK